MRRKDFITSELFAAAVVERGCESLPRTHGAEVMILNCPVFVTAFWLRDTDSDVDEQLKLFEDGGKPSTILMAIVPTRILGDSGRFRPTYELIIEAASLFARSLTSSKFRCAASRPFQHSELA